MTFSRATLLIGMMGAAVVAAPGTAAACGGCFSSETESTQVTGHRMILSISMKQTTLWDQITYAGDPESFAWVLPVKGTVEVGLSSEALFERLDDLTRVIIASPSLCPGQGMTYNYAFDPDADYDSGTEAVEVLKQEVVGPYETVQLSASDPGALTGWLASHGYAVPADVTPVIDGYVSEGFDFLALKLVPGVDVKAMRPVRITTPGASPGLPLRMVAAGTGAVTPLRLWVFGEGRYEPANFPSGTIAPGDLVWDWDAEKSNYSQLRKKAFEQSGGFLWLTDHASPWPSDLLESYLSTPEALASYADPDGSNAEENRAKDLDALQGKLSPADLWVTTMSTELSRKALANDLQLQASFTREPVYNILRLEAAVGTPPDPPSQCGGYDGDPPDDGHVGGDFDVSTSKNGKDDGFFGGVGCAVSTGRTAPLAGALGALLAAAAVLARRGRSRRRAGS